MAMPSWSSTATDARMTRRATSAVISSPPCSNLLTTRILSGCWDSWSAYNSSSGWGGDLPGSGVVSPGTGGAVDREASLVRRTHGAHGPLPPLA